MLELPNINEDATPSRSPSEPSQKSSPTFEEAEALLDSLPSDDEFPETISGTQVKKERVSSPIALPPRLPFTRGTRGDSPINLISSSEDEELEDPTPDDDGPSNIEDMYADPTEETMNDEDAEPMNETMEDTTNDEDAKMVDEVLSPKADELQSSQEIPPPKAPAATQPPLSSASVAPRSPQKLSDIPKPTGLPEKWKRLSDVNLPSASQLPATTSSPGKFKKPTMKARASLSSTQAFADSIVRSFKPQTMSFDQAQSQPQRTQKQRKRDEDESEAEEPRNLKRPRTSASASTRSPSALNRPSPLIGPKETKHHEYWLLDGSVIVCVQKTLFKLHRSTLVNKSEYFKRLISGPQAMPGNDGIPRINVRDVSVLDFERLLKAIDAGVAYVFEPPPFRVLASILRAASKLEFTREHEFALRSIRAMWPSDLTQLTPGHIPNAAATVNLAKDCDIPEILKRAYYDLVQSDALGQDASGDDDETQEDIENHTISREDLVKLIKTREQLCSKWFLNGARPPSRSMFPCPLGPIPVPEEEAGLPEPPAPFVKQQQCAAAWEKALQHWDEKVMVSDLYETHLYNPIGGLECLSKIDWESLGYCEGCVKSWREHWMRERVKLWQNLDIWLELSNESS